MSTYSHDYYIKRRDSILESRKKYRMEHSDKVAQTNLKYAHNNPDKVNAWYRGYNQRLRLKFLEMYGGKCSCCGEDNEVFLCIDHIQGQIGTRKKQTGNPAYRAALKEYRPDFYRILCQNCNSATRFGRICPHQMVQR